MENIPYFGPPSQIPGERPSEPGEDVEEPPLPEDAPREERFSRRGDLIDPGEINHNDVPSLLSKS